MSQRHPSLLDPAFKYVPSTSTDIRKTFAKVRARLRREAALPGNRTVVSLTPRDRKTAGEK